MVERKKIIFPYYNSYYTSTAIIIYQTNILRTLNTLPDVKKPHVFIWHNHQSPLQELRQVNYPYISFINIKSFGFRIKKLASTIIEKIGLEKTIFFNTDYDAVYPAYQDSFLNGVKKRVYWKADFQENYYPEYFTTDEKNWVKGFFKHLQNDEDSTLVLSSDDAWNDLKKFYPQVKNPVKLFRFVSHIADNINQLDASKIYNKFNVQKPYFIVCNQYWPHKNHLVVLQALHHIKQKQSLPFQIVFTGKTTSIRGNEYFIQLKKFIDDHHLQEDIVITDFVERDEQLCLMKNSLAIVQPTTFEGWSTVIEDGKALNHFVIASNLAVNMEQIKENVLFFTPHNTEELVNHLLQVFQHAPSIQKQTYSANIEASANDLLEIFDL